MERVEKWLKGMRKEGLGAVGCGSLLETRLLGPRCPLGGTQFPEEADEQTVPQAKGGASEGLSPSCLIFWETSPCLSLFRGEQLSFIHSFTHSHTHSPAVFPYS